MTPPLVVDIDGTMSREDRSIEGRVFDALRAWDAPVVIATGKAFPYPVALCDFVGIAVRIVAENGGVACADGEVAFNGDPDAARAVTAELRDAGHDPGWGGADLVNRWRETELAVPREIPREAVEDAAARHGQEVIDSGFAYHVKDPAVDKGKGLQTVAGPIGRDAGEFVAVGDSENDVPTFGVAGESYAVANADDRARAAADHVTEGSHADGLLEALDAVR